MSEVLAPGQGQLTGFDYLEFLVDSLPEPSKVTLNYGQILELAVELLNSEMDTKQRTTLAFKICQVDAKPQLQFLLSWANELYTAGPEKSKFRALCVVRMILTIAGHVEGATAAVPAAVAAKLLQSQHDISALTAMGITNREQLPPTAKDYVVDTARPKTPRFRWSESVGFLRSAGSQALKALEGLSMRAKIAITATTAVLLVIALFITTITPLWWFSTDQDPERVIVLVDVPNRKPVPLRSAGDYDPSDLYVATALGSFESREERTQAILLRRLIMEEQMDFVNLKSKKMIDGIVKVLALNEPAHKAVQDFLANNPAMGQSFEAQLGLPKENLVDLVLALIWRESQGDWNAKSPTGPVGPGQFTEDTGRHYGLVGVRDAKGNLTFDYRNDPTKLHLVLGAILSYLKDEYNRFNKRWDMAVFAYHSGASVVLSVTKAADAEGYKWETYDDLFFASPMDHPKTWRAVWSLMNEQSNYGSTYWYGVYRAMGHLWLFWTDQKAFYNLADRQRKQDSDREVQLCRQIVDSKLSGKPESEVSQEVGKMLKQLNDPKVVAGLGAETRIRFWSSFSCRDLLVNFTQQDMETNIKSGTIVQLPQGNWGINLRPANKDGIGALVKDNPEAVKVYQHLSPEAWGMFIVIAHNFRVIRGKNIDLTSLIRDWAYQYKLSKSEDRGKGTALPMHTLNVGGDIGYLGLSQEDHFVLQYIMDDMMYAGLLSWIPERDHYHVVAMPTPQAKKILLRVYQNVTKPS